MQPVAVVTGGGRGIGAAVSLLAAERGYAVCVNYLENRARAEGISAQIREIGGQARAIQADVASETDVIRLFQAAAELGPIRGLVNNAATLEPQSRLAEMEGARMERVMKTNILGVMLCAREAVRRMSTKRNGTGGAIVNVSSGAARIGSPGEYVDYAASKGAVDTFTLGLAKEVAEEGIRVNGVRPGFIYTEMHARGGEPDRVDRVKVTVPMQRGGDPQKVAAAILWLLSSEASYVTGAILDVTGGR